MKPKERTEEQTEPMEGQMSIFDLDGWCGKTSPEPCRAESRKGKISVSSSRSARESKTQTPLYLDLRRENGRIVDASWEMGGALLGQYETHSFTESHNGVGESRLSLILEDKVQPKYYLSPRACRGIIERATKRGKLARIPEVLLKALEWQSVEENYQKLVQSLSKNERVSRGGGKGLLIQEEHIGSMKTNDRQSVCYGFDPGATRDAGAQCFAEVSKTVNNGTCPGYHAGVLERHYPINGDVTPPLDAHYYLGCGARGGVEREFVASKVGGNNE